MAYEHFDETTPNGTQSGTAFAQSTRDNLLAMRDMIVMGCMPGWALAATGGTADQPTTLTYSRTTERIRAVIAWGAVGGAAGNPESIAYSYSANSGTDWDAIGTETITYDADGNVTASAWS